MTQQHAGQHSTCLLYGYPTRTVIIPIHTVKPDPAGRAFFSRRRWWADRCRRPGAPASPALPFAAPCASAADSRAASSAEGGCASARPYLRGSSDKPQQFDLSHASHTCNLKLLHALPALARPCTLTAASYGLPLAEHYYACASQIRFGYTALEGMRLDNTAHIRRASSSIRCLTLPASLRG